MVDNYKGEITSDDKFICFISRKELDYKEECGLDFKTTPMGVRWLISDEVTKEATLEAGKIKDNAGDDDKFTCSISGITYNTKQELSLVFPASSSLTKKLLISSDSCFTALQENQLNREKRYSRYK